MKRACLCYTIISLRSAASVILPCFIAISNKEHPLDILNTVLWPLLKGSPEVLGKASAFQAVASMGTGSKQEKWQKQCCNPRPDYFLYVHYTKRDCLDHNATSAILPAILFWTPSTLRVTLFKCTDLRNLFNFSAHIFWEYFWEVWILCWQWIDLQIYFSHFSSEGCFEKKEKRKRNPIQIINFFGHVEENNTVRGHIVCIEFYYFGSTFKIHQCPSFQWESYYKAIWQTTTDY